MVNQVWLDIFGKELKADIMNNGAKKTCRKQGWCLFCNQLKREHSCQDLLTRFML